MLIPVSAESMDLGMMGWNYIRLMPIVQAFCSGDSGKPVVSHHTQI
jgi:hypothetical protein